MAGILIGFGRTAKKVPVASGSTGTSTTRGEMRPRRVTTFILLILQEAKLRYARIEASDHFTPHTAGFA
ncbi:hypothetical protein WI85_08270 [Burkholderia ubonensis]|nr:hypothetical protein WI85_08270 [Burkholderia ubonensis]